MSINLTGEGAPYALQRLAREQIKTKLLADIQTDLMICQLEGWDATEYLADLHQLISRFHSCERLT